MPPKKSGKPSNFLGKFRKKFPVISKNRLFPADKASLLSPAPPEEGPDFKKRTGLRARSPLCAEAGTPCPSPPCGVFPPAARSRIRKVRMYRRRTPPRRHSWAVRTDSPSALYRNPRNSCRKPAGICLCPGPPSRRALTGMRAQRSGRVKNPRNLSALFPCRTKNSPFLRRALRC